MALIVCPECRREVSDKALACPHCGLPAPSQAHASVANASSPSRTAEGSTEKPRHVTPALSPKTSSRAVEVAKTGAYWAGGIAMVIGISAGGQGGGILLGTIVGVMMAVPLAAIAFLIVFGVMKLREGSSRTLARAKPTPETHACRPDCRQLIPKESSACNYCGCRLIPR